VFIDDATSKLMQLRFVPSESTDSYLREQQFRQDGRAADYRPGDVIQYCKGSPKHGFLPKTEATLDGVQGAAPVRYDRYSSKWIK
jgi:hypothetical protein